METASPLDNLLIDTWWFGLSARLDDEWVKARCGEDLRRHARALCPRRLNPRCVVTDLW